MNWFGKSVLASAAVATALTASSVTHAAERPNVLFIAVDDLKPTIHAFGDSFAKTPNMDALAKRGVIFKNAHCQQAVCAPSRVSLLTGLRPDTTRVFDLKTQFRPILPDAVTLPQAFKDAGYEVQSMGKIYDPRSAGGPKQMDPKSWSVPPIEVKSDADATFDYRDPKVIELIKQARAQKPDLPAGWDQQLAAIFPNGRPATDRADVPDNAYHDGAMTEVAVKKIAELGKSDKPFFLAVGYHKPHLPFNAPERYWSMYDPRQVPLATVTSGPVGAPDYAPQPGWELRAAYADMPKQGPLPEATQRNLVHGYYAATSYVDAQIGMLVKALDEEHLTDNTIIVVWGDHGWHLGDHGMWCKHTNYEQATRAPLIIVAPGTSKPGGVSTHPVEFVDIYPTLIQLAGVAPSGELHGSSLTPILKDDRATVKPLAISQFPRNVAGNAAGKQRKDYMGYAFRDERYRLVTWVSFDPATGKSGSQIEATELYDYEADPLETRNLADDPPYAAARKMMEDKAQATRYGPFATK